VVILVENKILSRDVKGSVSYRVVVLEHQVESYLSPRQPLEDELLKKEG
jgi:hypothetical protein